MKNKFIIPILFVVVLGFFLLKNNQFGQKQNPPSQTSQQTTKTESIGTLVLDDGDKVSTYSGISAQNAFEILTAVMEKEKIPLVTKQYAFGIFVQKIGNKESGSAMAWIYSINGKSGEVAADKAEIKFGDTVEWKYTKSIY
jgi:hypothetical protein